MRGSATSSGTAWGAGPRVLAAAALLALAACNGTDPSSSQPREPQFRPTTLLDAVLVGDRAGVAQFIEQGANVNATEVDGTTPLMRAIHGGFPEIAKTLINAGANVAATNRYGVSALYLAARGTDSATTRELLAAGADPNTALPEGETALMTAAKAGDIAIVRALLTGRSGSVALAPLAEAIDTRGAASGYGAAPVVVPSDPRSRANPNAKEGWYGQTALMWAAVEGHADIVRLLIAAGANVDEHSRLIDAPESTYERLEGDFVYPRTPKGRLTALHLAARAGELAAVQALVESGAELDAVDAEGTTALIFATRSDHLDVTRALLEAGADPNVADTYGRTLLFAAIDGSVIDASSRTAEPTGSKPTPVDIVRLALAKGADPNRALAEAPPTDVEQTDEQNPILGKGATPFFRAAMSGELEIMNLLLDAGAEPLVTTDARDPMKIKGVERPSNGKTTSLMAVAGVGWRESISRGREADAITAIQLLLDRGADVNAANQAGDTALHGATLRGSTVIIQFLVDHGANVGAKNGKGQTPLDIAMGVPDDRIPYNEATAALLRRLSQKG